jgi:hypothetical protein
VRVNNFVLPRHVLSYLTKHDRGRGVNEANAKPLQIFSPYRNAFVFFFLLEWTIMETMKVDMARSSSKQLKVRSL